jgi:tRNA (guanine37-N1)-methyltransferase
MVMNCQPIYDNILHIKDKYLNQVDEVIYLSPRGEKYNQKMANELSLKKNIVLVCGHYEGVDERLSITSFTKEISIGDFVLSGGESAACIVVDSITRLLDGSIKQKSYENDSFYDGNFLDYPQFTRPFEFNNLKVPEVLLSGNHKEIDEFRRFNSIKKTLEIRPDLINIENLSKKDKKILKKFKDDDYYRKK